MMLLHRLLPSWQVENVLALMSTFQLIVVASAMLLVPFMVRSSLRRCFPDPLPPGLFLLHSVESLSHSSALRIQGLAFHPQPFTLPPLLL